MANMSQRLGPADKSATITHIRLEDDDAFAEIYSTGVKLGSGSFGTVWLVCHKETGQEWACKCISKDKEKVCYAHASRLQYTSFQFGAR